MISSPAISSGLHSTHPVFFWTHRPAHQAAAERPSPKNGEFSSPSVSSAMILLPFSPEQPQHQLHRPAGGQIDHRRGQTHNDQQGHHLAF